MKDSNEFEYFVKTQLWHQWVLTVLERWKKSPLARYVDTDIRQLSARLRWQCLRAVLLFETANVCVQVYTALPPPQPLFYSPHLSLECKFKKKQQCQAYVDLVAHVDGHAFTCSILAVVLAFDAQLLRWRMYCDQYYFPLLYKIRIEYLRTTCTSILT